MAAASCPALEARCCREQDGRASECLSPPAPEPVARSEVKSCSPTVGSHAKIQISLGSKGHPPSKLHMPCIGSAHLTNSSRSSRQCQQAVSRLQLST